MPKPHKPDVDRRKFLINACGVGIGAAAGATGMNRAWARGEMVATPGRMTMPMRPFGKTGTKVPIRGMGGSLNLMDRQLFLAQALKMGVGYRMRRDFSAAEEQCPQRIAIGKFMRRAAEELG